jgi:hypothetical protein
MRIYTLQKGPCSFLKLCISPWRNSIPPSPLFLLPGAPSFSFPTGGSSIQILLFFLSPSPPPGSSAARLGRASGARGRRAGTGRRWRRGRSGSRRRQRTRCQSGGGSAAGARSGAGLKRCAGERQRLQAAGSAGAGGRRERADGVRSARTACGARVGGVEARGSEPAQGGSGCAELGLAAGDARAAQARARKRARVEQ